jgi:uncharacterized membrane protein
MVIESKVSPPAAALAEQATLDTLSEHVSNNIDTVHAYQEQEHGKLGGTERLLARVSGLIGRPVYLIGLLLVVSLWMCGNVLALRLRYHPWDPPPFHWLDGALTLAALLTTSVILLTQNRQAKIETQRAHLDLQVNLLTEQKVTKLIHLLEELRRDLPIVRDRHDPEAAALQQRTDTTQVLSALAAANADAGGSGAA